MNSVNRSKLPFEPTDPAQVAAAWTATVEPGDPAAGILRSLVGDEAALLWILGGSPGPLPAVPDREIPWDKCHARWHPRMVEVDVARDLRRIERLGGSLIPRGSPKWPLTLADLEEREPFGLWVMGSTMESLLASPAVSVVGSRAATNYGTRLASQVAADLAGMGITVVSGGAYGIDAAAHRGALAAQEAPTIAVLCGGLGNLYPTGNAELFRDICSRGLLITEVPPHWRPARWRFLERNRLIAALSGATVVVEAGERSGAIATANRAVELGRSVAAFPGPVGSAASRGSHRLIQDGAELVTTASEVAELVGHASVSRPDTDSAPIHLRPIERIAWDTLPRAGTMTAPQIALVAGLTVDEVEIALLGLKLAGIAAVAGGEWCRSR